ncbi:hypothetical protein GEMRC1_007167 [Eukaryota sp. GEM-RC1]
MTSPSDELQKLLDILRPYTHFIRSGMGRAPPPLSDITSLPAPEATPEHDHPLSPPPASSRRHRRKQKLAEETELISGMLSDEDTSIQQQTPSYNLYSQPKLLKVGTLRSYQLEGVSWMARLHQCGLCGILADEMGLGKTIQTIALIAYLKEFHGVSSPHLIVVPKSTLPNWVKEFNKWLPSTKVEAIIGGKEERKDQLSDLVNTDFDVIVTTYELVSIEKSFFKKFAWYLLVVDEGHRLKSHTSKLATILRSFTSRTRLLLTGTPLQNNIKELWSLLYFLRSDIFPNADLFESWFKVQGEERQEVEKAMSMMHAILSPFFLRRVKSDVEDLPPKTETIVHVKLSGLQKEVYKGVLKKDLPDILTSVDFASNNRNKIALLNVVMQLRKVCNHPYLFEGVEPGPPFIEGDHIIKASGKLAVLDKLLSRLEEEGSKVLIFSQMTRVLDILEDYCSLRQYSFRRLDGQTDSAERQASVDEFQRDGSDVFVFLLSTRAGGLGINLTAADTVVLFDSDWNPQSDLQAIDRAHRIGQKRPVRVFRLVTEGTVEEKILERAMFKLQLDALIIQQGRIRDGLQTSVDKKELMSMIKFGADRIFSQDSNQLSDADIDALLNQSQEKSTEIYSKIQTNCQKTLSSMDFSLEHNSKLTYEIDGDDEVDEQKLLEELKSLGGDEFLSRRELEKKRTQIVLPKRSGFVAPVRYDYQFFPDEFQQIDNRRNARKKFDHDLANHLIESTTEPPKWTDEDEQKWQELFNQGFGDWSRTDYNKFIRALEKFGYETKHLPSICESVNKDSEEVERYFTTFWKKFKNLQDGLRIQKSINKAVEKRDRAFNYEHFLSEVVEKDGYDWKGGELRDLNSKSRFSDEGR